MKRDIVNDKFKLDDNGFFKVDTVLASAGVMDYRMPDGRVLRGFMEPESLKASLDNFAGLPLTNNHPTKGLVNPKNYKELSVGYVDSKGLRFENGKVVGQIVVASDDGLEAIQGGKNDVSLGYKESKVFEPGVFVDVHDVMGEGAGKEYKYDFIKTNMSLNHLALVDEGRSKAAELIYDHEDSTILTQTDKIVTAPVSGSSNENIEIITHNTMTDQNNLKSIVINDTVVEVSNDSANVVLTLKQTAQDAQAALDSANGELAGLKAKNAKLEEDMMHYDSMKGELEALKALKKEKDSKEEEGEGDTAIDADVISTEAAARLSAWTMINALSTDSVEFVPTNSALDTKRAYVASNFEVENVADASEAFLDGMLQVLSKSSKKTVTNFVADTAPTTPAKASTAIDSGADLYDDGSFGISLG